MSNHFRISSGIPRKLEELQIAPISVLRRAGLPIGLFSREKILVTTEEFFAFFRAVAEVSDDPAIGLRIGTEDRYERYDPIAIAALCTRSFGDAIHRMARYKQLMCPEEIEVMERGNDCEVHFRWLLAREEEPTVLVDVCFAWMLTIARRGSGETIFPKQVEFRRKAAHREMYEKHFGCPVKFGAAANVLVFSRADMDGEFLTHNSELLAMVAPRLEAELNEQLAQKDLGEQVKGILKRLLAGQRPGIQHVAKELRMSSRTLQRRLTEKGVTFQQLMEEARRELARHYLSHSALELNETAYLLGYEDANSFFRAFQRWEGTSPGQWRALHVMPAITESQGQASEVY
jgi:AraC-like DNA-binding protein